MDDECRLAWANIAGWAAIAARPSAIFPKVAQPFGELVALRQKQPTALHVQKIGFYFWISLSGGFPRAILRVPIALAALLTQIVQHETRLALQAGARLLSQSPTPVPLSVMAQAYAHCLMRASKKPARCGCVNATRLIIEINVRERLPVVVAHDKAQWLARQRSKAREHGKVSSGIEHFCPIV